MADKYSNPISTRLLLVSVIALAFFYWASRWSHIPHEHGENDHNAEMHSDEHGDAQGHDHEGDHSHPH